MSTQTINVQIPLDLIVDQVSKSIEKKLGKKLLEKRQKEIQQQLEFERRKKIDRELEKETWLTRIEAAKKLKVSLPTLRKYSTLGVIKVYYFGSNPRYKLSDVEDTLKELPTLKHKHNI